MELSFMTHVLKLVKTQVAFTNVDAILKKQ